MAYEVIILYHLHMPWYYVETFTEYPFLFVILTGGIRPMNCNCITVQFQIVRAV